MENNIVQGFIRSFQTHKTLVEQAIQQLDTEGFNWKVNDSCNSISVLIKHVSGHLTSRFQEFWTSDGERADRDRAGELTEEYLTLQELQLIWNKAWNVVFNSLNLLKDSDLYQTKQLRQQAILVADYIPRVLTHFTYHGGQIVLLAKQYLGAQWQGFSS